MKVRETKGFTLVEMAVVVALVGIVIAMSLPALGQPLANYRLKTAARQIAQDLREVQQMALNEETDGYRVSFSAGGRTYLIQKTAHPLPRTVKRVELPPTVLIAATTFNNNTVTFTARGTPHPRGGTVTLQDRASGRFLYVIVASITGRVRVSSSPPDSWEVQ